MPVFSCFCVSVVLLSVLRGLSRISCLPLFRPRPSPRKTAEEAKHRQGEVKTKNLNPQNFVYRRPIVVCSPFWPSFGPLFSGCFVFCRLLLLLLLGSSSSSFFFFFTFFFVVLFFLCFLLLPFSSFLLPSFLPLSRLLILLLLFFFSLFFFFFLLLLSSSSSSVFFFFFLYCSCPTC